MSSAAFFVMIKPDGVKRGLVGEIISRFEKRGFELVEMRMVIPGPDIIREHYTEHSGKGFYNDLITFSTSGPVIPMMWRGNIQVARRIVGETVPWDALVGTIRGDFACSLPENLVHCSDSLESAKRELELWFGRQD